jgi:hypothetical protein
MACRVVFIATAAKGKDAGEKRADDPAAARTWFSAAVHAPVTVLAAAAV